MRSLETTDELMPTKDMLPECESPSNTESDRDPNTDELPSKPADGENDSANAVAGVTPKSSDEEPAAGEGLSEEVYEVEKILDHDETKEGLFYLVHWKGFSKEDDSWEPAENLIFATKAIDEYESARKSKSKRGKRPPPKTPKGKNEKSQKKGSSVKSTSSSSRKRTRQKASAEKSDSEPEPEIPSDDIDDEDYSEKPKTSKKGSAPPPKGSGTVTKAALKSYSPTTPKNRRGSGSTSTYISPSETLSAAKKDFEVKPDQMQALLMRQSWLYDSDSDDDSGTEKENEKRMEQRKQIEEEQLRIRERDEEQQKQMEEASKATEEPPRSAERKRKVDEVHSDKKKKIKSDVTAEHVEVASPAAAMYQNGDRCPSNPPAPSASVHSTPTCTASAPSTSFTDATPQEEVQIFAIGKVNDGRIRVVIGNDQAKKVVSLRDAHDANSWGLLQHLLQYAVFDDFDD